MKIRHPEKVNKPINPLKKKPSWIRSKLTNSQEFFLTKSIVNQHKLKTVWQEANCPNITECWSKKHATFMIMGDTCTRACAFCDVKTGKPGKLDPLEPFKISSAVKKLNLIENKIKTGYPEKFRTCWGKNTSEQICKIGNMLHNHDLEKGITLARQTN